MVGIKNGLRLILDLHSDYESFGTVSTDYSGFQASWIIKLIIIYEFTENNELINMSDNTDMVGGLTIN